MADQNSNTRKDLTDCDQPAISIAGMVNVIKQDRALLFSSSSSIRTITDMLYKDLVESETGGDTMTGSQKEGLLQALSLVGDNLTSRWSDLNDIRFADQADS